MASDATVSSPTTGRIIVLEGWEGAGKSTQKEILQQKLESRGVQVELLQEPGGDPVGQALRSILKGELEDPLVQLAFKGQPYEVHPRAELLLFNAARVHALEIARLHLDQGKWVVADRSSLSTLAYQGHGRGLDMESVRTICQFAIQETTPDLVLLLDAPYEVLKSRVIRRGGTDRIESAGDEVHQRIHRGYQIEAELHGIPVIDASGTVEEVHEAIWRHVEPLLETSLN